MTSRWFSTPNLCTFFRLAMSPILLALAYGGRPVLFVAAFAAALLSDVVDGFLARRLKIDSEEGARLDSWSDLCLYWSAALGVLFLAPEQIAREQVIVWAMAVAYVVPILHGFVKFRRLICYHTWGAKLSAVLGGCTIAGMVLFDASRLLWVTGPVFVAASVEEIAITAVLPAWRPNVASLWHALRIRRNADSGEGGTAK